jgi:hypothetical protein
VTRTYTDAALAYADDEFRAMYDDRSLQRLATWKAAPTNAADALLLERYATTHKPEHTLSYVSQAGAAWVMSVIGLVSFDGEVSS